MTGKPAPVAQTAQVAPVAQAAPAAQTAQVTQSAGQTKTSEPQSAALRSPHSQSPHSQSPRARAHAHVHVHVRVPYVVRRLAAFIVAALVQSAVIFAFLRMLPGDAAMVLGGTTATPEQTARLRAQMGLDRPYPVQYLSWLSDVLHGNLGVSQLSGKAVGAQVGVRMEVTLPLAVLGLAVALAIGIPLGVLAVTARSAKLRRALQVCAIVAGSIPALWGGLLLVLIFGKGVGLLGVLPSQGFPGGGWRTPGRALASLALPALSIGIITGAQLLRYVRSALVDVCDTDYIAQAMVAGMTRAQAVRRVGLRLAAPQIVSVAGLAFASMMTGVVVVENLFALPGFATLLMNDLKGRDFLAVQSELLLLSLLFLVMGLVVDMLHHALVPRLKDAAGFGADVDGGAAAVASAAVVSSAATSEGDVA